jgi:hypothetical protein
MKNETKNSWKAKGDFCAWEYRQSALTAEGSTEGKPLLISPKLTENFG